MVRAANKGDKIRGSGGAITSKVKMLITGVGVVIRKGHAQVTSGMLAKFFLLD